MSAANRMAEFYSASSTRSRIALDAGRLPSNHVAMQHDALAHTEDFGGPDQHMVTHAGRPGRDAPYGHYTLGPAFDEMFARDGAVHEHYAALDGRLTTL